MPLSDRDRRTLKIGGIVLGVIVVGYLLFSLLTGGGDSGTPAPVAGGPTGPTGAQSQTPSPTPVVPPVQNFTGRDPFSVPPILQTTSAPTGATGPSGATGPTTAPPTTFPPTTTPTTPPPTTPGGGSSKVVGGHTVVLLDVFPKNGTTRVQVEVDGTVYNVAAGTTFAAGQFKFTSASGNCANFLYGDSAFTLCATASK